jgi:hypothetical protein
MNRKKFETIRIPEALRGMTLRELQKHWDGNLSQTVEKMQRDILEREKAEQRDKEERERLAQEGAKRYVSSNDISMLGEEVRWPC